MNERPKLDDKTKKEKIRKTILWALVVIAVSWIASFTHYNVWASLFQAIVTFFALREVLKI
ncbi:hypothetical protein ACLJJ6_02045 [Pediococcus siamensis]|uniref:hypothetical protein n=1 Tax=Pediococcus siamensis TaxID=381829 RepID=UPI0039A319C6